MQKPKSKGGINVCETITTTKAATRYIEQMAFRCQFIRQILHLNSPFWLRRWANLTWRHPGLQKLHQAIFSDFSKLRSRGYQCTWRNMSNNTINTRVSALTDFTVYFKSIQFKIWFLSLQCFQSTFRTTFVLPSASTVGFNAACINMTVQFSPLLHTHLLHHTNTVIAALGIRSVSKLALFLWLNQCPSCNRRPIILVKEKPEAWH